MGAGRAGGRWASVRAGRAGYARDWACWALGRQALGSVGRAGPRSAGGRAEGRAADLGTQGRAGRCSRRAAGADRGARGGRLGVHVRAAWACWLGQLGQVGALCTWLSSDSVFGPGSTRYFSRVTK